MFPNYLLTYFRPPYQPTYFYFKCFKNHKCCHVAQNYLSMCMNQGQLKINSSNLKIGKKIYLVNIV